MENVIGMAKLHSLLKCLNYKNICYHTVYKHHAMGKYSTKGGMGVRFPSKLPTTSAAIRSLYHVPYIGTWLLRFGRLGLG
jgi:hypothetical protein